MTRVTFESIPIQESGELLVDLGEYGFELEASYFNQGFSSDHRMYLRQDVAEKLAKIQESWRGEYRLKIWDGFRPREVQNAIYQSFYDRLSSDNPNWSEQEVHHATEQFFTMANKPERIPPHSTGGSVDLTVVDGAGNELDMGTEFDFFGPEAAPHYYDELSRDEKIAKNRRILREAMLSEGFTIDDDEWWHFDYGNQLWALRSGAKIAIYGESQVS